MPLTIGTTDCKEWTNYERWIKGDSDDINVVCLKTGEGEESFVSHCDGILLSGGEDVHPSLYDKPEYIEKYNLTDFNVERDMFELRVIREAQEFKIPLLGICRGLQIANVFFKGTLVPDLPSFGKTTHSAGPKTDSVHSVTVSESKLSQIIGVHKGDINSHHHQAADRPGKGLFVTSLSEDGVIEGLEKSKKHDDEFFQLVQWHPERMDSNSPFSGKLRAAFIKACEEYNRYSELNQSLSIAP